jgi:hypothetical protein
MISWRFWRSLQTPYVAHPIYRLRGIWRVPPTRRHVPRSRLILLNHAATWVTLLILCSIGLVTLFGTSILFILICGPAIAMFFLVLPLTLITIGTLYGLATTLLISNVIAIEKIQGRLTLMTLTSRGLAGATWALCSLEFHTNFWLVQTRSFVSTVYFSTFFILLFALYPILFTSSDTPPGTLYGAIAFAIFILDYIQSTNVGCLIGMLAPTYANSRAETRNFGLVAFLTLQFATYLLIGSLCVVAWPLLGITPQIHPQIFASICLVTYYMCREIIIVILAFMLAQRLNTPIDELDDFTQVGLIKIFDLPGFSRILYRFVIIESASTQHKQ